MDICGDNLHLQWRSLTLMLEITYTLCGDHLHTERWFPPSVPCCSSPQLLWWIGESEDGPSEHFMKLNWCKIANMVQTSWNEHGAKINLGFTWPPSMGFHSSWVTSGATLVRSTCTLERLSEQCSLNTFLGEFSRDFGNRSLAPLSIYSKTFLKLTGYQVPRGTPGTCPGSRLPDLGSSPRPREEVAPLPFDTRSGSGPHATLGWRGRRYWLLIKTT